jgi:hypothetical protein
VSFLARLLVYVGEGGKDWQRKQAICKSEAFPIPLRVFYLLTFKLFPNLPFLYELITHGALHKIISILPASPRN